MDTPSNRSWLHPLFAVAIRMLIGDRAKYLGLIFAIAFSSFLISQQSSLFVGLMSRTRGQIRDVTDADIWVMDAATKYFDEVYALRDSELYRVRGVPGVEWAVPLFKGNQSAKTATGFFRSVLVLGLDDASLTGVPRKLLMGNTEDLRLPDAAIIDRAGYNFLYPGQPLQLGRILELNDHRIRIVGICIPSAPFIASPILYTRYSLAVNLVGRQRTQMSFLLAKAAPGADPHVVADHIRQSTGLKAVTGDDFGWMTINYYLANSGIPINFGLTVAVAIIVGAVVAGQTFYIFTIENLKQFGALKAIGATNARITGMIMLQALLVGFLGYSVGITMTAGFFFGIRNLEALRDITLLWPIMLGTFIVVIGIVLVASLLSIRKVIVLEPAIVFRG
jgi:putative ABC transport system permease protein